MLLLGLAKSLCTTQLKKVKSSAPTLLPVQWEGVLPFATGRIKAVVDGGGRELLISQGEEWNVLCELQPVSVLSEEPSVSPMWDISRGVPRGVTPEQQTQQLVPSFVAAQRTGNSLDNCSERCRQATICGQRLKSKKSFPAQSDPKPFCCVQGVSPCLWSQQCFFFQRNIYFST